MSRRFLWLMMSVALLVSVAACGGSEPDAAPTPTAAPTTTVENQAVAVTGDEEKVDPIDTVQEFAEHLRQGDMEAAAAFLAPEYAVHESPELLDLGFWEWVSILEKPEFTDCQVVDETADGSKVSCFYLIGEDSWFSRVMGSQATTTFTAFVDMEGTLTPAISHVPPGQAEALVDFREWIRATHPADEDRMFGDDYAGVYRFSKESAVLHMQYLDEYLTYRETNE